MVVTITSCIQRAVRERGHDLCSSLCGTRLRNNVDKLVKYSQYLKDLKLVDYKVRILNTGTEAVTRVSIESTDSKGKNWFTIGVSANIIDASFKALVDSLDYKLFKDNAPASL